jgi:multiple sugar transport system substrate-binding protein
MRQTRLTSEINTCVTDITSYLRARIFEGMLPNNCADTNRIEKNIRQFQASGYRRHIMLHIKRQAVIAMCWLLLGSAPAAAADKLVVDFMISSGKQRDAWVDLVNQFAAENPDLEIVRTERGQEDYKRDFGANLETNNTDVAFWFAGERLRHWSKTGLLRPLDTRFVAEVLAPNLVKTSYEATRVEDRVYGFPLKYYQWGFFYRKSLFLKLGLLPPSTWSDFLQVCERLQKAGVRPLAVGGKDGWSAAAWFDYLDLRINGAEFHQALLKGEVAFSDRRVRAVFSEWRTLLGKGYFLPETMDKPWDSVMPFIYHDLVGMALLGGSITVKLPAALRSDIGFFPFPRLNNKVKLVEEAPLDVLVTPSNGQNPAGARRFLTFLATTDALNTFNERLHTVSPRRTGAKSVDPFVVSANGITLFFDRDAVKPLINPAFESFKQFLLPPHDVDAAIRSIDRQFHR